jgi:hypothetical protein
LCLAGHIEKGVVFETETLNGHDSKFGKDGISPLLSSSYALSPCCELGGAALWVCTGTAAIIIPLKPMIMMTALIG